MTQPRLPKARSHQAYSLMAMLDCTSAGITHRSIDRMTDSYRLAAYIWSLRQKGWDIESVKKRVRVHFDGQVKPICYYVLNPDQVAALTSEAGQEYMVRVRKFYRDALAGGNRPERTNNNPKTDTSTKGGK